MTLIDLTWKRFGRLVVCSYAGKRVNGNTKWLCRCDCGKTVVVLSTQLRNGGTKSCGCLQRELARKRNTKHGQYYTRLYEIWRSMKKRVTNKNCRAYRRYGGRGIDICKDWIESFDSFFEWAKSSGYSDGLTIDRIDNDKGYHPENCRWATQIEQARNKSTNRLVTYNGITQNLSKWAEDLGLSTCGLWSRIQRHGVEEAIAMGRKR